MRLCGSCITMCAPFCATLRLKLLKTDAGVFDSTFIAHVRLWKIQWNYANVDFTFELICLGCHHTIFSHFKLKAVFTQISQNGHCETYWWHYPLVELLQHLSIVTHPPSQRSVQNQFSSCNVFLKMWNEGSQLQVRKIHPLPSHFAIWLWLYVPIWVFSAMITNVVSQQD